MEEVKVLMYQKQEMLELDLLVIYLIYFLRRSLIFIFLLGFPSVGKSTLLNKLTGTFSEVASYEFTTLTCVPGIIYYQGAKIQLLDLPGIIEGAKDGKGRGRQVIAVGRTCDLICIVLDSARPITHKQLIEVILYFFNIFFLFEY